MNEVKVKTSAELREMALLLTLCADILDGRVVGWSELLICRPLAGRGASCGGTQKRPGPNALVEPPCFCDVGGCPRRYGENDGANIAVGAAAAWCML